MWNDPSPPRGAHWSWPAGAAHTPCVRFWQNGTLATPGVRSIAETGVTSTFKNEVTLKGNGARAAFQGRLIRSGSGTSSAFFTADRYHPLVSALSMIAPSPDWIVGVDSLPLCNGSQWLQKVQVPLYPWDAGTDSGLTFTSPNSVTSPPEPIARITTTSLRTTSFRKTSGTTSSLGTFTFQLTNVDTSSTVTNPKCSLCKATTAPPTTPPLTTGQGLQFFPFFNYSNSVLLF